MKRLNKKAISPLIATVLLVAFAVALGAVVMSWAKGVEGETPTGAAVDGQAPDCLVKSMPSDPLKQLQLKYLLGQITKAQYIEQEKALV